MCVCVSMCTCVCRSVASWVEGWEGYVSALLCRDGQDGCRCMGMSVFGRDAHACR